MKKTSSIISHTTPVGGNVFLDLGFEPEEAARLKRQSDVDCQKLTMRRSLQAALTESTHGLDLAKQGADNPAGMSDATLAAINRGEIGELSLGYLIDLLLWTGRKVTVTVSTSDRNQHRA